MPPADHRPASFTACAAAAPRILSSTCRAGAHAGSHESFAVVIGVPLEDPKARDNALVWFDPDIGISWKGIPEGWRKDPFDS
jgi:hypothetical protein